MSGSVVSILAECKSNRWSEPDRVKLAPAQQYTVGKKAGKVAGEGAEGLSPFTLAGFRAPAGTPPAERQ